MDYIATRIDPSDPSLDAITVTKRRLTLRFATPLQVQSVCRVADRTPERDRLFVLDGVTFDVAAVCA